MLKAPTNIPGRQRQFLWQRKSQPALEPKFQIKTIKQLRTLLQEAVELEHLTIPPYLCALYSIREGTNPEAAHIIKSVVMEEMLHMVLAANVLNAIGGKPSLTHKKFIPNYPTRLPVLDEKFRVGLRPFSKAAIQTFIKIERPRRPQQQPKGCSCIHDFRTIGQFYDAIQCGLIELSKRKNIFTGDSARQITSAHYYGGGGKVSPVADLASALEALKEIVGQGEGVDGTIWDGDERFGDEVAEVAHFFRFKEILAGRHYKVGDKFKSPPSGARFSVSWNTAYPMRSDPKMAHYKKNSPLWKMNRNFNRSYQVLLKELHLAFNGQPQRLMPAVPIMHKLKYQAIELMQIPIGRGRQTAGPSFERLVK